MDTLRLATVAAAFLLALQLTPTNAQAGTSFCATSSTNGTMPDAVVINFDTTLTAGSGWSLSTDTFTVPTNGYYWFHFSVAMPSYLPTEVRLVGLPNRTPLIERQSGNAETTSRCELVYLTTNRQITLNTAFDLVNDQIGAQVSFSGFPLDRTMRPVVAFNLGLNVSKSSNGVMPFTLINEDTHLGWDNDTNRYIVPVNGTWVITLHCGDAPLEGGYGESALRASGERQARVYHSYTGNSEDINSITVIYNLNINDTIDAAVLEWPVYSDPNYPTSIMGFLYQPISLPAVAWCVAITTTEFGPDDPLIFSYVSVNVGDGWNATTNVFTAPASGVYYVTLSGAQNTAGAELNMELQRNNVTVASIYSDRSAADTSSGVRTRSRAITLNLFFDDELKVVLPSGASTVGLSADIVTSFSGFRISP